MKTTRITCSLLVYPLEFPVKVRQESTDQPTLIVDAKQAHVMPSPQPDPVWSYQQAIQKYGQFTWTSEREL